MSISTGRPRPAFFLDRDGTLIREVGYLSRIEQVEILPEAIRAVQLINQAGAAAVVVTNQSGVARGFLGESQLEGIHQHLLAAFSRGGAHLDAFYYCPHHPHAEQLRYRIDCSCRKPAPGMLRAAARDLNLDLTRSIMLGDTLRDVEAGRRAGCRTVLVRTGKGMFEEVQLEDPETPAPARPDHIAANVLQGVRWALESDLEPKLD